MRLGWTEILVVLAVVLLLFGSTRLPALGKALGKSLRNFKQGMSGADDDNGQNQYGGGYYSNPFEYFFRDFFGY